MSKYNVTTVGEADEDNENTGRHILSGVNVEVWFGDNFNNKTPDEAMKVAKLIAAAPEMLEACKWMYNELQAFNMLKQDERVNVQLDFVHSLLLKATT
jgi:hypothetical protein